METGSTQTADDARLGRRLVEMHRLGIVGTREGDDVLFADADAAKGDGAADLDVFEVDPIGESADLVLHGGVLAIAVS